MQPESMRGPQLWRWLAERPGGHDDKGFRPPVDDVRPLNGSSQRSITMQAFGFEPHYRRRFGRSGNEWTNHEFKQQFDVVLDVAFRRGVDRTDDRSYGKGGGLHVTLEDERAWGCLPSSCNSLIFICCYCDFVFPIAHPSAAHHVQPTLTPIRPSPPPHGRRAFPQVPPCVF